MILWFLACTPEFGNVVMNGIVHDEPDWDGTAVEGAQLTVVGEDLAVVGESVTASDGSFLVDVPAGQPFFLTVGGDDFVPTHFSGTAGMSDFYAGDGYPWVARPDWIDALRTEFSACPAVDAPGAVVAGDVRLFIQGQNDLDQLPPVNTAHVSVYPAEGDTVDACYLDDDGVSVADAWDTGNDGAFAAFGLPAGGIVVEISFEDFDQMYPVVLYQFVVADSGFVPLYPALVYEGDL